MISCAYRRCRRCRRILRKVRNNWNTLWDLTLCWLSIFRILFDPARDIGTPIYLSHNRRSSVLVVVPLSPLIFLLVANNASLLGHSTSTLSNVRNNSSRRTIAPMLCTRCKRTRNIVEPLCDDTNGEILTAAFSILWRACHRAPATLRVRTSTSKNRTLDRGGWNCNTKIRKYSTLIYKSRFYSLRRILLLLLRNQRMRHQWTTLNCILFNFFGLFYYHHYKKSYLLLL